MKCLILLFAFAALFCATTHANEAVSPFSFNDLKSDGGATSIVDNALGLSDDDDDDDDDNDSSDPGSMMPGHHSRERLFACLKKCRVEFIRCIRHSSDKKSCFVTAKECAVECKKKDHPQPFTRCPFIRCLGGCRWSFLRCAVEAGKNETEMKACVKKWKECLGGPCKDMFPKREPKCHYLRCAGNCSRELVDCLIDSSSEATAWQCYKTFFPCSDDCKKSGSYSDCHQGKIGGGYKPPQRMAGFMGKVKNFLSGLKTRVSSRWNQRSVNRRRSSGKQVYGRRSGRQAGRQGQRYGN